MFGRNVNYLIKCLNGSVLAGQLQLEFLLIHQRSVVKVKAFRTFQQSGYVLFDLRHKEFNGEDQLREEDNGYLTT